MSLDLQVLKLVDKIFFYQLIVQKRTALIKLANLWCWKNTQTYITHNNLTERFAGNGSAATFK